MSRTRPTALWANANRSGFTLVELLVVIAIIGVLAALLTVGLFAAFGTSKDFVLNQQVTQVAQGVEAFKTKYGCYPPDMSDVSDTTIAFDGTPATLSNFNFFNAFINKAYPRADRTAIAAFCTRVRSATGGMDQAEALAFFLGGTSKDPRYPLGRIVAGNYQAPQQNELDIFFEFPPASLVDLDTDGIPEFSQKGARGAPLVYFDARTYTAPIVMSANAQIQFQNGGYTNSTGVVTPYASGYNSATNVYAFHNPKSFQLICAGQNGEFGVFLTPGTPQYPVLHPQAIPGLPRVPESDGDNIANFTNMKFDSFLAQ
jgi:prepilin-type N-terminal cleavage/methylation domain-containing protein